MKKDKGETTVSIAGPDGKFSKPIALGKFKKVVGAMTDVLKHPKRSHGMNAPQHLTRSEFDFTILDALEKTGIEHTPQQLESIQSAAWKIYDDKCAVIDEKLRTITGTKGKFVVTPGKPIVLNIEFAGTPENLLAIGGMSGNIALYGRQGDLFDHEAEDDEGLDKDYVDAGDADESKEESD